MEIVKDRKKYDKEYSTQYIPEMKYLLEKGIKYTFVKQINGITTYKYTKTPELFMELLVFYSIKNDNLYDKKKVIKNERNKI